MPALELSNAGFTYPARRRQPARQALREINLVIDAGQSVALLGPNGSGKSTLIRLITGIATPTSGSVRVLDAEPHEARRSLSVVFQHPGLDEHMTVWENLRDSAALFGISSNVARQQTDALLNELRLSDRRDALVKSLSGGLARRVDLCRALLTQPRLLVLDEPTTGLDPTARREFLDHIAQRRAGDRDLTLLMTTHLIDEAERMDRVLMLHDGRIVADGSPAELRRQLGVRRVTVHDARWQPQAGDAARWTRSNEGWIRDLNADDATSAIARDLAESGAAFSIAPPTLADAYERLTGARLEAERAHEEVAA